MWKWFQINNKNIRFSILLLYFIDNYFFFCIKQTIFKSSFWGDCWFYLHDCQNHHLLRSDCSSYATHQWVYSIWTAIRSLTHTWSWSQQWKFHGSYLRRTVHCSFSVCVQCRNCQWLECVVPYAVCVWKTRMINKQNLINWMQEHTNLNESSFINQFTNRFQVWITPCNVRFSNAEHIDCSFV